MGIAIWQVARPLRSAPALAALWLGVSAAGCAEAPTCRDTGCTSTEVCDPESGACLARVTNCRFAPELCSASEVCSLTSGRCVPASQRCAPGDASCPRGQACDASVGVCRTAGVCRADAECSAGERCGSLGRCEARRCVQDSDCAEAGLVCDEGACRAGCRPGTEACPEPLLCRAGEAGRPGACVDRCERDAECDAAFRCEVESGSCVARGPCSVDQGCAESERCVGARCVAAPCASDEACGEGRLCEASVCVGPECSDDTFAPNQSPAEAATLESPSAIANLRRCAGRDDFFAVRARRGERIELRAIRRAGPPLALYLTDEFGRTIAVDEAPSSELMVARIAERDATWTLRVAGASLDSSRYDLALARGAASCRADAFEPNDAPRSARPLALGAAPLTVPIRLCPNDVDWFAILDRRAEDGLRVGIREPLGAARGVEAALYTPGGEVIALGEGLAREIPRLGESGDYALSVRATDTIERAAEITVSPLGPWDCTAPAPLPPWDAAERVSPPAALDRPFCLGTEGASWTPARFVFEAAEAGRARVTIGRVGAYELRATMWSRDAGGVWAPLRAAAPVRAGELEAYWRVTAGALYGVEVAPLGAPGRILTPPSFRAELALDAGT